MPASTRVHFVMGLLGLEQGHLCQGGIMVEDIEACVISFTVQERENSS